MVAGYLAPSLTPYPAHPDRVLIDGLSPDPGSLSNTQPVDVRSMARTGTRAGSYFDDYYNRVHILPATVNFGHVANATDRAVNLWNAYLTTTTLTGVSPSEDGVVITGAAPPAAIPPLAVLRLNAHANELGPATIDATFTFAFNRPDALALSVTGVRARLWPFKPNWRTPVDTTPEYRTDIITSRSGNEQRRALRTQPRRTISYSITLAAGQRQRFTQLLNRWQNRPILMGDPVRKTELPEGSPASAGVFTLYDIPSWLTEGRQFIFDTRDGMSLATVTGITDSLVTFSPANPAVLHAGTTIRPALTGRLTGTVSAEHPVNRVAEANIVFAVEPGTETVDEGEPSLYIHNGREVFTLKPNWADSVTQDFEWPVEQVDYGFGRVATYTPTERGWFTQQASFLGADPETTGEIESFFHRMRGRRGEFHMPTGMEDMTLRSPLVSGTALLRVTGTDLYDNYNDDPRYRSILLRTTDGRLMPRSLTGMYLISDGLGDDTILELSETWLSDVALHEVAAISWMPVFRLGSDELTFEWPTDEVAQVQLAMRSLEDRPPDRPLPGLDEAARWVLENWGPRGADLLDRLQYAMNVRYPAIFWWPLPWVMVNEKVTDSFDWFVNVEIPEAIG